MNRYEERQEARRRRLLEAASKADAAAGTLYGAARRDADCIPFGQPILVGHHSEGRDRRFRARIQRRIQKSCEERERAQGLRERAEAVGTAGISSDDPEAVAKLEAKLAGLEGAQQRMKAANAAIRKAGADLKAAELALVNLGFTEDQADKLLKPDYAGRVGFPSFSLANNNAEIRRSRARLEELRQRAAQVREAADGGATRTETAYPWGTAWEDLEENRVGLTFQKANLAAREAAKALGFRWSPTRGAWVRQLNGNGRGAAALFVRRMAEESTTNEGP